MSPPKYNARESQHEHICDDKGFVERETATESVDDGDHDRKQKKGFLDTIKDFFTGGNAEKTESEESTAETQIATDSNAQAEDGSTEAELANTIAHELNHARDFIKRLEIC